MGNEASTHMRIWPLWRPSLAAVRLASRSSISGGMARLASDASSQRCLSMRCGFFIFSHPTSRQKRRRRQSRRRLRC